jgi:hypothetical protein
MDALKTISFLEGEIDMTRYVAYQQDTGTGSGHPFLHLVPAGATSLSQRQISAGVHHNQPKPAKNRSTWVNFGRNPTKFSQLNSV